MKVICVAGNRGSGKTTAATIFQESLPNSMVVDLGVQMFGGVAYFADEFEKIFGIKVDLENLKPTYGKTVYSPQDAQKTFYSLNMAHVEGEAMKLIAKAKFNSYDYCVLLFHGIGKMNIWQNAEYRILLDMELDERKEEILRQRQLREHGHYKEGIFAKSRASLDEYVRNLENVDFIVTNNYDEQFRKDLVQICDKIKNNESDLVIEIQLPKQTPINV